MKNETSSLFSTFPQKHPAAPLIILLSGIFLLSLTAEGKLNLQEQKVVPSDASTSEYFGHAVAIDGTTAVIGAYGDNGFDGAAYVFNESNGIWSEGQKLTASDGGGEFGNSVALSGDTLVVGAPCAAGGGAVYVFNRTGNTWVESQRLAARDEMTSDNFGVAIALAGQTLVVGADKAKIGDNLYQGAAYVFVESNGRWREVQKLTANDGAFADHFGRVVAADGPPGRGPLILVSSPNKDVEGLLTGEVYVFTRPGDSWILTQNLIAEDSESLGFGSALAVDDGVALIGAPYASGSHGAVYFYSIFDGVLTQTQRVTSKDSTSNDDFGASVALLGNRAVVGAPYAEFGANSEQGKAYAFQQISGTWTPAGRIIASDGTEYGIFGTSVALDGDTILVGATPVALPQIGAAYFYAASAGFR